MPAKAVAVVNCIDTYAMETGVPPPSPAATAPMACRRPTWPSHRQLAPRGVWAGSSASEHRADACWQIARHEFPPVIVPPALRQARYANPTIVWTPETPGVEPAAARRGGDAAAPASPQSLSARSSPPAPPPTPPRHEHDHEHAQEQEHDDQQLPRPLTDLLASIERTLTGSFPSTPPHTVQRLAELIRWPTRHYRTLPSYLRAVERAVSVSSGADAFPLPHSAVLLSGLHGTLNGTVSGVDGDPLSGDGLTSDGPSLSPIPWLAHTPVLGAEIEKLSILGIRSFDNTRSETIRFQTPLTLIVGENGSGKTTIIEALKYATTGELPPNSKGGAFMHDPKVCKCLRPREVLLKPPLLARLKADGIKIAREKEVLAQVKLLFKATTGARMVATRNLQLTVKKTTRQQKTLEGNLLMTKDGQRTSVSSRVAELDQLLPQYLGVSKAILESVIFCHQEDSLWPMSEPSVLKKKFDDIFEASKYTKAIDNIKVLRKKQNELLSNYKIMEQHAKENKDKADKAEKRSLALSNEIETLRKECEDLTQQMQQAAEAADRAWRESEGYAEILGRLSGCRVEAQSLQDSIARLQEHLDEIDESDEWLESTLREFQARQSKSHHDEESMKQRYLDLQRQMDALRQKGAAAQTRVGEHKRDKEHYELQVTRRKDLVRNIARQNSLRGYERQLDDQSFADFMSAIERLSRERKDALSRAKEEAQAELAQAQGQLNELDQKRSALVEAKKLAKKQIIQNNREAETYQNQLNDIDVDEGKRSVLEKRAQEAEAALEAAKMTARQAAEETEISEKSLELQRLEERASRLNTELIEATQHAGDLARLDLLRQELQDRQQSLKTMMSTHSQRLRKFIRSDVQPSTIERAFQQRQREAAQELVDAERARDGAARDLDSLEEHAQIAKTKSQDYLVESKELARVISDVINDEPSEYPAVLRARQEQLDSVKEESNIFEGRNKYLETCIREAGNKNACLTCRRRFRDQQETEQFIAAIRDRMRKSVAEDIQEYEEDVDAAKEISKDYDRWLRLTSDEIPALEREINELDGQRTALVKKAEEQDRKVLDCTELKQEMDSLAKIVVTIARYDNEITTYEKQIEELAASQSGQGSTRTLADIRSELDASSSAIRSLQGDIDQLKAKSQEAQNEINRLELRLRDLRTDLAQVVYQLEKQASCVARIEDSKHKNNDLRAEIDAMDKQIEEMLPMFATAQARYDDVNTRAEVRRSELERQASQISENIFQIKLASQDIDSYAQRGGDRQLDEAEAQLASIQHEVSDVKRQQGEVTKQINALTAEIQDAKNTERKYTDNLQYRQLKKKLAEVNRVIGELSSQNAEVDRDRFVRESEKWSRKHTTLSALCASKKGEMKSKDNQLVELLKDWEVDYKDARYRYKEAHIKVAITKAAIDDLAKYGGALDNAIMKYHSLKMEEINRIIEELWQKTYKGTDVDTVLIRSDNETARGNRSYNYRVCMVKRDAEMDMRGRCSAGQKMLASIIIRLALAECFGVNCGLIALDEPTTNLDALNIQSLAESLHDIIRERRQQANFQLIVITHDEEFLRHMKCGEFCDYYYRVSRDERQKSVIERQNIVEVL
ncbi:DNA repair protein rad50 [Ascosphaera acerosa]|nr:DNA repair protein rad50 [Ascosphaera acerosa]